MSSHVTTLTCAKDTYVNSSYSNSNYGSSAILRVAGTNKVKGHSVSILGFDISSIGSNKIVTGLKLNVYLNGIIDDDTESIFVSPNGIDFLSLYPVIMRTRRLKSYSLSEIETSLNASVVKSKEDSENILGSGTFGTDYVKNISYIQNSIITMDVTDISEIINGEVVVGMFIGSDAYNASSGMTYASFSSREGGIAPTLTVYYEDYTPQAPYNLTPNATFRNKNGSFNLGWEFSDGGTEAIQQSAEVVYSTDGFVTSTTRYVYGNTNYVVIADETFSDGQIIQWKVRVTDTNGDITDFSSVASFTIGATVPNSPELISPNNTIINSSDVTSFRWKFIDNYGYSQGGFTIEIVEDGGKVITYMGTTGIGEFTLPKNSITGGNYKWRVQTYNEFGEYSNFSGYKTFYSIGKPNAPTITSVSNNCRPIIKWNAPEQDLYHIRVLQGNTEIYNSGERASDISNEYQIPEFLTNGTYTIAIKISNVYGFWSNESTYNIIIETVNPDKPSLFMALNDYGVSIVIDSTTTHNILYRKGTHDTTFVQVAETTFTNYIDYMVSGRESQYFIRSISDDSFSDSDIKKIELPFSGILLANENDLKTIINLKNTLDSDKQKTISMYRDGYKVSCVGRDYPILQRTEFRNYTETHEFFVKEIEKDVFIQMINDSNIVFYRDNDGTSFYAEIANVAIQANTFGYIISFTLTKIDRS